MHSAALRPLSAGEILDGAFVLYRRHHRVLLAASALPVLPLLAGRAASALLGPASAAGVAAGIAFGVLEALVAFTAYALVTQLFSAACLGAQPRLGEAAGAVLPRLASILTTIVVVCVLVVGGFLLLVLPGLLVSARYFAVVPAAVVERCSWREARRRSRELSRGAEWPIAGIVAVTMLLYFLPAMAAGALLPEGAARAAAVFDPLWSVVATPLTCGIYVLLYYDRRVRTEALDVRLAAERLPVAAGAA